MLGKNKEGNTEEIKVIQVCENTILASRSSRAV
jgi:hypothetical protein